MCPSCTGFSLDLALRITCKEAATETGGTWANNNTTVADLVLSE